MEMLFRKQAIEHQKHRLHGDILLLPRFSHSIILTLLICWFLFLIYWLCSVHYARKETVLGWVEPADGVTKIYAPDSGVVEKVLVVDGEHVEKDQPLLEIVSEKTLTNGAGLEINILTELEKQRNIIVGQLDRSQKSYHLKESDLKNRLNAAKRDLESIDEQYNIAKTRHSIIETQLKRADGLRKEKYISSTQYENAQTDELEARSNVELLFRSLNDQKTKKEQLALELIQLPDEAFKINADLKSRLSEIDQQTTQVNSQASFIVKSPNAGIINNTQVKRGQRVFSNNNVPLLTVYPDGKNLQAHLLVPVRSVAFLEPGQALTIRYDAFPYQKFGTYSAKITQVSTTVLLPHELLNVPVGMNEPTYRVSAAIETLSVDAYGKSFPLKPGMTLSGDISVGDRTLIEWLLEPMYSVYGHI